MNLAKLNLAKVMELSRITAARSVVHGGEATMVSAEDLLREK